MRIVNLLGRNTIIIFKVQYPMYIEFSGLYTKWAVNLNNVTNT